MSCELEKQGSSDWSISLKSLGSTERLIVLP
jgi:hypothetical protein